jgi:hypothetical protein
MTGVNTSKGLRWLMADNQVAHDKHSALALSGRHSECSLTLCGQPWALGDLAATPSACWGDRAAAASPQPVGRFNHGARSAGGQHDVAGDTNSLSQWQSAWSRQPDLY